MSSYNLGTAAGRIIVDGSGAEEGFGVAEKAAESFQEVLRQQLDRVDKIANRLLVVGGSGAGAIALMTHSASAFQKQLSGIEAVSGATAEEMDLISEAALRIGARTQYSATEAAAAMEELIKAGLTTREVLDGAADATVDLAAAGEISLPRAAEIAANAMNNFNVTAAETPRVADLIAGAANASAISVEEFGTSLSQVGAVANLAGLSFDDTAVAIAEMGNAGIKGSDAGTSLKTMFMNLIPTTERQVQTFQDLGLLTVDVNKAMEYLAERGYKGTISSSEDALKAIEALNEEMGGSAAGTMAARVEAVKAAQAMGFMSNQFFDAEGDVRSLAEIQGVLAAATKDMTREQKLQTLEIMFGQDAIRAAAVMATNGAEGFNDMAEAMGKVGAQEVAETRMNNLAGAIEMLRGAWETLSITIGQYFLKPAQKVVEVITWFVDLMNAMPPYIKAGAAAILGLGSGLALTIGFFLKILPLLSTFIIRSLGLRAAGQAWSVLTAGMSAFRATGGNVSAVLAAMATQARSFGGWIATLVSRAKSMSGVIGWIVKAGGALVTFISGPVGWTIAAIAALALIGKVLYDKWEPFRNLVDRIAAAIKDFFIPVIEQAKANIAGLIEGFKTGVADGQGLAGFFERVGAAARFLWEKVKQLADMFMQYVWPAVQQLASAVRDALAQAWQSLVDVWNSSLKPALEELWSTIVNELWPALQQLWQAFWPILKVILIVAGVIIGAFLAALYILARILLEIVLPAMIKVWSWIATNLIGILSKVATWIVQYLITPLINLVSWLVEKVSPAFSWLADAIGNAWGWIRDNVVPIIRSLVDWFKGLFDGAKAAGDGAGSAFQSIIDWVVNAWNNIKSVATGIFETLAAPFHQVAAVVVPIVSAVFGFIGTFISGVFRIVAAVAGFMWEVIKSVFEIGSLIIYGIVVNIGRFISWVWNNILTIVTNVVTWLWNLIQTVWNAIASFATTVWNAILNTVKTVWDAIVTAVTTVVNTVRGVIESVLNVIKTIWANIWNGILTVVGWVWDRIGTKVMTAVNGVKNLISGIVTPIVNTWTTMWNRLVEAVQAIKATVEAKVRAVVDSVKGFFSNAIDWLRNAGRDIINGLVNGITDKINAAREAVSRVAESVKGAITDFFGISSPAKLMIEMGGYIMDGWQIGMQRGAADLVKTVEKINLATEAAAYNNNVGERGTNTVVNVTTEAPSVNLYQTVNAPQTMNAEQVAAMTARRTGYVLAGHVTRYSEGL